MNFELGERAKVGQREKKKSPTYMTYIQPGSNGISDGEHGTGVHIVSISYYTYEKPR